MVAFQSGHSIRYSLARPSNVRPFEWMRPSARARAIIRINSNRFFLFGRKEKKKQIWKKCRCRTWSKTNKHWTMASIRHESRNSNKICSAWRHKIKNNYYLLTVFVCIVYEARFDGRLECLYFFLSFLYFSLLFLIILHALHRPRMQFAAPLALSLPSILRFIH